MSSPEGPSRALLETPESAYGSDKNGIVWAYLFVPGQPARQIDSSEIERWLAELRGGEDSRSFLWLHLSLSNVAAERWMRDRLELPDTFYESLHEHVGSTRLEQDGPALIAVVHDVVFGSTVDTASVSTVSLCIEPQLLVSARLRSLRSVDRLRAGVRAGHTFRSTAELLSHLLRDQAEVLVDIVRQSTFRIDGIEDGLLAGQVSASRRELGTLRRTLVRLQRLLAPEPAALFRLLSSPPAWISSEDLQELREAAEQFSAAIVDSAALVERVRLVQEEFAALVNEQTSRTLFVLTVVTVLALPINLVAGLFGMNVGGIPLSAHRHGFFVIIIFLAFVTCGLAYFAFRNRRD